MRHNEVKAVAYKGLDLYRYTWIEAQKVIPQKVEKSVFDGITGGSGTLPSTIVFWYDSELNIYYDDPDFGPVVRLEDLCYNSEIGLHICSDKAADYNTP